MPTQDADWVESTITKLGETERYQHEVPDGWYETLPVPKWNHSRISIVIRIGRTSRTKRPGASIPVWLPRSPHLEVEVSFPSGEIRWSQVDEHTFPVQGTDIPPKSSQQGNVMELRRAYYRALSLMLAAQSPLKKPEQITPNDCTLVANVQKTLYDADTPDMLWYYGPASEPIRSWLIAHCQGSSSLERKP